MRFANAIEVNDFLRTVDLCEGEVWITSPRGDKFVLKSVFSRYLAMAALLAERGDELELFCQLPEDRAKFYKYFNEHPDVNS